MKVTIVAGRQIHWAGNVCISYFSRRKPEIYCIGTSRMHQRGYSTGCVCVWVCVCVSVTCNLAYHALQSWYTYRLIRPGSKALPDIPELFTLPPEAPAQGGRVYSGDIRYIPLKVTMALTSICSLDSTRHLATVARHWLLQGLWDKRWTDEGKDRPGASLLKRHMEKGTIHKLLNWKVTLSYIHYLSDIHIHHFSRMCGHK